MQCVIVKKSKSNKQQEASGLLRSLGIKTPLSKIPFVGPLLFWCIKQVKTRYEINEIVNKFLLAVYRFINTFKTAWIYIESLWTIYKKTKKEYKSLKKQEIYDIFIKTN